jgi:hypothetical protein
MYKDKIAPFSSPNYDVFSPARRSDERGILVGVQLDGGQSYLPWIGLSTIRQLALKHSDKVGLVDEDELLEEQRENADLRYRLQIAEKRAGDLDAQLNRIGGLAREGFKVQKIMGRPTTAKKGA